MEKQQKALKVWRIIAIVALCLLALLCTIGAIALGVRCVAAKVKAIETYSAMQTAEPDPATLPSGTDKAALPEGSEQAEPQDVANDPAAAMPEEPEPLTGEQMLSLWTTDARAKNKLIAYIEAVTDENNADFIPVENRIAVFDLDGTLFCETDPNYFDYTLLVHRVLEDPDYIDKASDYERETAMKIVEQNLTGASFKGLEVDHGKCIASSFAGMTLGEFNAYIQAFKKLPMPSYDGMLRGDGWYKPMLEVVEYLKANDFTIYVVSGTDRLIVRGIADNSPLGLPMGQIIGSDETIVTRKQNGEDGLTYVFNDQDELILGGDFLIKNLKMNKVAVIAQEIGVQPVLSFGNSTGDSSMAEYATSNNPYKSLAFMLCCDDVERENGNVAKADKMYALCEEFDWVPISMKNDWTTIYGEGVTKHEAVQNPELEAALAAWQKAHEPEPVVLSDDSSDFVLLSEAVPDAILEIRYYSTYNFVGERIDGYEEPLALLTKEAAAALKEVSDELLTMGYRLKVFDAYRPQMAVTHFMNWALDPDDTRMKDYFYPELDKSVLFPQGYIAEHSGHSRGSTVDLTLFDMATEKEVDMGGTFDYFGELSHPDYLDITTQQYANRMLLREVMLRHGFVPLEEEWWHFTLADEPYPDTYFTFPINSVSVPALTEAEPTAEPATDAESEQVQPAA